MTKTTEEIDKEIEKVSEEYGSVEEIIGELAAENGRCRLVHRELRTFTWFVAFMIFSRAEEGAFEDDLKFKREYENFKLGDDSSDAEDLFKWACLYYIYSKTTYKEIPDSPI